MVHRNNEYLARLELDIFWKAVICSDGLKKNEFDKGCQVKQILNNIM